jgi:hypothetical protein
VGPRRHKKSELSGAAATGGLRRRAACNEGVVAVGEAAGFEIREHASEPDDCASVSPSVRPLHPTVQITCVGNGR